MSVAANPSRAASYRWCTVPPSAATSSAALAPMSPVPGFITTM
ncbi:MAG TPA: hypothetical protein VE871_01270 [Longimicrobium sp.]|nr:hypothetical protein [Longimicrobium sp.]